MCRNPFYLFECLYNIFILGCAHKIHEERVVPWFPRYGLYSCQINIFLCKLFKDTEKRACLVLC